MKVSGVEPDYWWQMVAFFFMSTELTSEYLKAAAGAARRRIGDVPVRYAVLAWNPTLGGAGDGRIMILPHGRDAGEYCGAWADRLKLSSTYGACNAGWETGGAKRICHRLLVEAWHIVVRDGLNIQDAHEALMVVPEMRLIIGPDAPWPYSG